MRLLSLKASPSAARHRYLLLSADAGPGAAGAWTSVLETGEDGLQGTELPGLQTSVVTLAAGPLAGGCMLQVTPQVRGEAVKRCLHSVLVWVADSDLCSVALGTWLFGTFLRPRHLCYAGRSHFHARQRGAPVLLGAAQRQLGHACGAAWAARCAGQRRSCALAVLQQHRAAPRGVPAGPAAAGFCVDAVPAGWRRTLRGEQGQAWG